MTTTQIPKVFVPDPAFTPSTSPSVPVPPDPAATLRIPVAPVAPVTGGKPPVTGGKPPRSRRRKVARRAVVLVVLAAATGTWALTAPVPVLDSYLTHKVTAEIGGRTVCPGSTGPAPQITLGGGRLLPQLLHDRLAEIRLSAPDIPLGGARHTAFSASLAGVGPLRSGTPRAETLTASITTAFADMPPPPTGPHPTFSRAADGSLAISVVPAANQAKKVTSVLYLELRLRGDSVVAVPQRLRLFGHVLSAQKATEIGGGARSQKLPALPAGLHYTAIRPERDGLHVTLGGTVTTALSALPTHVGDRTVSYTTRNGLLGIATAIQVPPIIDEPLTIFTEPLLQGDRLTLVPRSVEILGSDRLPDDPIAAIVLSQVKAEDLTRTLPALPAGVRYTSVGVDETGVKVGVGGTTVRPLSDLPAPPDVAHAVFGAEDGLLTVTSRGMSTHSAAKPVVLYSVPTVVGTTLDLSPRTLELFGIRFTAAEVLPEIKIENTSYPLQKLAPGLSYAGVDVLPTALRINLKGSDVALTAGLLGGGGCR
ncbi:MAG TPA: hypothetical protein VI248_19750 [Kineosporiaceae bacterium]